MCVDGETSSANFLQLTTTEADLSNPEHAIKIRKPYMITKQRERWTEEEHNKFLEALKLYGRAWRRIEEYIGSKTTVQIRSHAQKFFSKVTRESSSNSPGIVEAIEIPPPRPKKKPNHPYPRKLGHLSIRKGALMDRQLWPSLSKQSGSEQGSEQESKSPTSVLSAFGSDTLGSTAVDTLKPCMSPVSSVDRAVTAGEMLVEQVSGSKSSSTSSEYKSNHSTAPSASSGMRDESPMELDLASKEAALVTGQQNQMTSLKLFGRTFVVAESQQPLSNKNESKHQEKIDLESQNLHEKDKPTAHPSSSYENRTGPLQPNMVSFPSWWELYGVMALHFSRPMNPTSDHKSVHIDPNSNESSEADSGTTSDGNSEIAPPALALKPSKNSAFNSFRPSSSNRRRGFVPYRR